MAFKFAEANNEPGEHNRQGGSGRASVLPVGNWQGQLKQGAWANNHASPAG